MLSAKHKVTSHKALAGVIVASTILIAATTSKIYAQQDLTQSDNQISMTAIPPRLGEDNSLQMKPGEKRQVTLRVVNSSSETIVINSMAQDFVVGDDGQTPVPIEVEDADNRWSLASWLTVVPGAQRVAANQTASFNVLIEVPEDALPGGHYAMITYQPNSGDANIEEVESGQTTGVNQKVGTLLYLVVEGPINEQAFIRDFKVPQFLEFGPVKYSYTVENQSDVHIRPQMGIQIKNIFGKKVADIQPETKNIFPFTSRSFEGQWDRIWGFGRYKAEVIMTYGTQNQLVVASTMFWLFPIKLIIAILVAVLLVVLAFMSIRRHIIHKKQDQSKKITELETKLQQLETEKLKKFEE